MPHQMAKGKVKMASVDAVVIRKDGTREDHGTVSYWHRNPLRRWAWHLGQWLRGRRAGKVGKAHSQKLDD